MTTAASVPVVAGSQPASAPAVIASVPQPLVIQLSASAIQIETRALQPETPWYISPGIVGWLALVGVLLGLLANYLKMRAELKAAAEEAHKDRITAARKEIYSELVGEFVKVTKLFGELPSIDIKENPNYADDMIPLAVAVNRTWLIGEVETTRKVRAVHGKVQELFLRLVAHLPPLQDLKERVKLHATAIAESREERNGYLRELRKNSAFNTDPAAKDDIQGRLLQAKDVYENILHGAAKARDEDTAKHQQLVAEYNMFLMPSLAEVMKGVQEFMYDARIEMGIKGENDLLSAQTDDLFQRAQTSLQELAIAMVKIAVKVV